MDEDDLKRRLAGRGRPDAVLIAGPTASGKSDLAVRLAAEFGGEVVNADSMQVYRDLEVLTARPDAAATRTVPHRLFGHIDGAQDYSVGHWLDEAGGAVRSAWARGALPVVTGGTGLYFKALSEGLAAMPEISPATRERWRFRLAEDGPARLHRLLRTIDPQVALRVAPTDSQRIVRALEVFEQTGRSILAWQQEEPTGGLLDGRRLERVVLQADRGALRAQIGRRFERMVEAGALGEVERLLARRLDPAKPVMKAIGVAQLGAVLAGEMALEDAIGRARIETGRYAKRQDTWFRNQMPAPAWPRLAMRVPSG